MRDGDVLLWNAVSGQLVPEIRDFYRHSQATNAVAFSPDGRTLASASDDGTVAISDISDLGNMTNMLPVILTGHLSAVEAVAFSPDGTILASASTDGTVQLWDATRSYKHLATLSGNARAVVSVTFSPNGGTLASAGADGTVRLWDVASRSASATLTSDAGASSVTFSPDNTLLAVADAAGTPVVWDVDPDRVAARICELQPSLTRAEWSTYVPDEPYRHVCR
jgi:WD40 repeat protein